MDTHYEVLAIRKADSAWQCAYLPYTNKSEALEVVKEMKTTFPDYTVFLLEVGLDIQGGSAEVVWARLQR